MKYMSILFFKKTKEKRN